jgi:hypothetical protein
VANLPRERRRTNWAQGSPDVLLNRWTLAGCLIAARARGRSGGHKLTHARQLYAEGKHTVADVVALFGGRRQTARD